VRRFADARLVASAETADDPIVRRHVAPIDPLPDLTRPGCSAALADALVARGVEVAVPQISMDWCRHLDVFDDVLRRLRERGVAIVAHLHNVLPHDTFALDRDRLAAHYARCDGYVVGNERQRALLVEHFEVGERPVAIGRHGPSTSLDLGRFDRAGARRHLELPASAPIVLFFGNTRPNKGLDLLIEAAPRLCELRPDALVYASTNAWLPRPEEVEPIVEALRAFGARPGVRVRFELLPSLEIEPTFRACDVVALPYHAVSQSGLLGAARAFRKPVVATDVFDGVERLAPGEGRIVPARDPHAFAEGLAAQLADPTPAPPPDETIWDEHACALERVCRTVGRLRGVQ
jgi:glycosyltransferase involved in cell wall biosynthesis